MGKRKAFPGAVFLVAVFCGGVVLLSWGGLWYQLWQDRSRELENAFRQTENLARAFGEHTLRTVENVHQVLGGLEELYRRSGGSSSGDFPEGARRAVARFAVESQRAQGELFNLLSIADHKGDLVLSSQVPFQHVNIIHRPFFQRYLHGERGFLVEEPILGKATGKWYIPMSLPVLGEDDAFGGVVLASVNPFYFSDFYRQVRLGRGGCLLLLGASGNVLAGFVEGAETPFGTSVASSDTFRALEPIREGVFSGVGPTDAVRRILAHRIIAPYRHRRVVVGVAEESVLQGYFHRREVQSFGVLAFNLFVGGFFLLARRVIRREREARDALRQRVLEEQRAQALLEKAHDELSRAYEETIRGWARALELRDLETGGHAHRVTEMTVCLASRMGIEGAALRDVRHGALLHDVGKMGIPDSILLKPGELSEEEWVVMRRHPSYAVELLAPIGFLSRAVDIPACHHEKWDGSGYPRGLRGNEIPLAARIFAVVDVWDALRWDRPYRKAWPEDRVRDHLRLLAGNHLDPQVVREFFDLLEFEICGPGEGELPWAFRRTTT